jgi:hypothetical protein
MPVSATLAGFFVWITNRNQWLEDRDLLKEFLLIMIACMLLIWGTSTTDAARMYLDPQFRLQTELDAQPVYAAIKRFSDEDRQKLEEFLVVQLAEGKTLPEAFVQARTLLVALANYRLGFSDQKTHLLWARVTADSLKELQAKDPALCYQALPIAQPLDQQTLATAFSAENTQAFQQAIIALYESADRGMSHDRSSSDKPVEFNAAALEYRVVQKVVEEQFGEAVAEQLAKRNFPEPPLESRAQMCAAKIVQLEAMLERPQAMASQLLDSVLR